MSKKKAAPPAETPGAERLTSAPEAAGESPAETAPETPPGTESGSRAVVHAGNGLNLREGPGPAFEIGAVLPDGAEVSVLTLLAEGGPQGSFEVRIPGWSYVFTGRLVGWVDSGFLSEAGHGVS